MLFKPDDDGLTPDFSMLMSHWVHWRTGDSYRVQGFVLTAVGERWLWYVRYRVDTKDAPEFARALSDFFGNNAAGEPRFRRTR